MGCDVTPTLRSAVVSVLIRVARQTRKTSVEALARRASRISGEDVSHPFVRALEKMPASPFKEPVKMRAVLNVLELDEKEVEECWREGAA